MQHDERVQKETRQYHANISLYLMQSSNKFAEHLFIYDVLPASWSDAPINLGNMHLYGASWLVIF